MNKQISAFVVAAFVAALAGSHGTAATLIVTNANDGGAGSLRQAILDANATIGLDTIEFKILPPGVYTITLQSALPTISDPVVIDGTTQPGFVNTPVIEINGAAPGNIDGLRVVAGRSTIRGLAINRCGTSGIHLQAPGGTNFILGNFIGTDPTGTLKRANGTSGGIWIEGSAGNWIGGTIATNRNLISGNAGPGVYLLNCASNTVQGNLIGLSVSGTTALGNTNNGVTINGVTLNSAAGNVVGGTSTAARNFISGNGGSGVYLNGLGATGNLVQGNYVGTDTNGSLAIGNGGDGVTANNGAKANTIGGTNAGAGNLLSGNSQGGVGLKGAGTDSNLIQGNLIGTDVSGRLALGNTNSGVTVLSGNSNLIGGATTTARNIISANKLSGVFITNSVGNLVQGNFIGVDVTGANALGNGANGVSISSAGSNTVGGTTAGARNIISGNANNGIEIFNAGATANLIQGNYIGANATGQSALANKWSGVFIFQAAGNTIGGIQSGAGNVISGNATNGVFLSGAGTAGNQVQGNLIGVATSGTIGLGNGHAGVGIDGAPDNIIGGTTSGAGNVISANVNYHGIYLLGSGATRNLIQGNKIGTDITGDKALGSPYQGIYLDGSSTNTIGGATPGAGNLISGNGLCGVYLNNASWNVLQGNFIGTQSDGVKALGNLLFCVECRPGSCNNTIGGPAGAANRLAFSRTYNGSGYAGVRIRDGSTNNAILGNAIFSNDGLGIDLGAVGPSANISCGNGTGANMAQNYPVLAQAVSGNGTGIRGTLNSKANRSFVLQFFAIPTRDPSGYGEGQIYLGQQTVVTGNYCTNSFVVALPNQVPVGYAIAATATDSANNTSEFSACVAVTPVPALTMQPTANQQMSLAWPNTATGFALKQTDSLSPPIQWTDVTNTPADSNGQLVVTLATGITNRFYALRFE